MCANPKEVRNLAPPLFSWWRGEALSRPKSLGDYRVSVVTLQNGKLPLIRGFDRFKSGLAATKTCYMHKLISATTLPGDLSGAGRYIEGLTLQLV